MKQRFENTQYVYSYDPRDQMLGDFDYADPEPMTLARMSSSDFCWMEPGLEQLLVSEMVAYGWLIVNADESISLTDIGRAVVQARLEKKVNWSDNLLRSDAPALPKMSSRLAIACRASIHRYPDNVMWQGFEKQFNV